MKQLPPTVQAYKRTPTFTQDAVPPGLLHRHTTKEGAWAKINILSGSLTYQILEPALEEHHLDPAHPGVVEPQVPHQVKFTGPVSFFVEFYREPGQVGA